MGSPIPLEGNAFAQHVNEAAKRIELALAGEDAEVQAWALFAVIMQSRAIHLRVDDLQQQYTDELRKHGD